MRTLGGARARLYAVAAAFAFLPAGTMEGCAVCGSFEEKSGVVVLAGLLCPERNRPPNAPPIARFRMDPNPARPGQTVILDASTSSDPDGEMVKYEWDFDPYAGGVDQFEIDAGREPRIERQLMAFPGEPERPVSLRVTDARGARHVRTQTLRLVGTEFTTPPTPRPPTASFTATPNPGFVGESVHFDGSASSDPDGGALTYRWDFEGDGGFVSTGADPTTPRVYDTPGTRQVRLQVTDPTGLADEATVPVTIESVGGEAFPSSRRPRRGSRFSARLRGGPLRGRAGTLSRRGNRVILRGLLARGTLRGKVRRRPSDGPSLKPFLSSRWTVRLTASVRPSRQAVRVRGVALARFPGRRAGRACLRIAMSSRRGRPLSGTFRVTGGRATAARLRAVGRLVYRPARGRLRGTISARQGSVRRMPAACRRLA